MRENDENKAAATATETIQPTSTSTISIFEILLIERDFTCVLNANKVFSKKHFSQVNKA